MRKPPVGEANLGAMVGAIIGAIGGLVAVLVPLAIITGDIKSLSAARHLSLMGFIISTPVGWIIGGQIGPRLEGKLHYKPAGIIGGILGALVPIIAFAIWGWFLIGGAR